MKVGQQFQDTKLKSHRQPCIVWFEKHNNGTYLVEALKEVQGVRKVFLILINSPTVPDAWSVDEVEPFSV